MRFQIPQFIEIEDKIFGPLSLKQFIYLAGGAGLSFMIYSFLKSIVLSTIPIILIMALSATLAFYKINGRTFIQIMEYAFKYYTGTKLYIWKKQDKKPTESAKEVSSEIKNYASVMVPKISDSKLKDLTWSLDIQESIYSKKSQK